jgi:hypothetical protein
MSLPVLVVVDRDPHSPGVLLSDVSWRFGNDFTLTGEVSPELALSALREMATTHWPVALVLVDDAGAEFLAQVHALHPRAKRGSRPAGAPRGALGA